KEIAAKWLDYGYSEKGHMLFNFGVEGESYNIEDDYPKYSEVITENPDGLSMGEALALHTRASYNGPFVQDRKYQEQYQNLPQQQGAIDNWLKADDSHRLPPTTPTPEESENLANIMNEINTYVDEMRLKFIMGQESLDKYDEFVENIKK